MCPVRDQPEELELRITKTMFGSWRALEFFDRFPGGPLQSDHGGLALAEGVTDVTAH